jgi:hypothetical protein
LIRTTKHSICFTVEYLSKAEKHYKEFAAAYDDNNWKETVYWCEEMDELYTKYYKFIEYLYKLYSGLRTAPGRAPFMSLEEFKNIVIDFGFENSFLLSEVPVCYNLAMMTQEDEVDSERCAEMNLVEFMEAFARLADMINLQGINIDPNDNALTDEQKANQKLWVKTEALLKHCASHARVNKKAVAALGLPAASIFTFKGTLIED